MKTFTFLSGTRYSVTANTQEEAWKLLEESIGLLSSDSCPVCNGGDQCSHVEEDEALTILLDELEA